MRVLLVGGTGFIGQELTKQLIANGYLVTVLTRNKVEARKILGDNIEVLDWDEFNSAQSSKLQNIQSIINLTGESIGGGRWTKTKKEKILNSRIESTRAIVNAIKNQVIRPQSLINASAVGFYGPKKDEVITENDPAGKDFLADVSKAWELEADKAESYGVRVVKVRIGVVLGRGGALKQMLPPFKFYLGGSMGSGEQWFSWIHINDLVGIIKFAIENENIKGPINGTAPNPVKMKEFSNSLGRVLNKPSRFNIPSYVLRLILGEMADMVLNGQRVLPDKLFSAGYQFQFAEVEDALADILK